MSQNTFQLIVAADSTSSYVLFLYDDLEWSQTDSRSEGGSGSGDNIISISGSGFRYNLVIRVSFLGNAYLCIVANRSLSGADT